jgi:TP901 family phage tail tape measure protein
MTATTAAFGRTAEAAAMRTSRRFNSAGTTMLYTGAAIATGLGYAVNEAVKFEKAMATVSTTIDNTTPEMMKGMGEEVLAMSKRIPKSIEELTTGLYDVVSAGIEGSKSMTVLNSSGRLAVAGLGTTQEAVDVLTSSINSFNMDALSAEGIANDVFKAVKYGKTTVSQLAESFGSSSALVKNSNVTLKEYLATTAVLTTTGMTASRAQTQVSSAITALIKPSKTMQAIFDNLGVKDIPKFIKSSKGLIPALEIVKNKADEMGILTSKAFGRKEGFSAMLSLLGPLRDKYDTVLKDMIGNTDTLTESVNKQQATTAAGFQRLKNNATILAIRIGDQLLPVVNDFIDRLTPTVDGISEWIKRNSWLASTLGKVAIALLTLGLVAKVGAVLFYGLAKAIQFVRFVTATATAVTALYEGVMLTAALTGQGLAVVLWEVAAAFLAAAWPVLVIVAALGLLTYALFDTMGTSDDFISKQVTGLDKTNKAWENSTKVQSRELQKQKQLMESHNPNMGKAPINASIAGILAQNRQDQAAKAARIAAVPMQTLSKTQPIFNAQGKAVPVNNVYGNQLQEAAAGTPKNLAGSKQLNVESLMKDFGSNKGQLDINIKDPGKLVESVDESNSGGIPVKVTKTGGNR